MFVRNFSRRGASDGWIVQAPAKINLALEVLNRRHDGFHEVETLLIPVRLFDTLRFRPSPEPLSLSIRSPSDAAESIPTDRRNLVVQAAERLAEVSGRPATGRLELWKRIPSQAGLGGGSSDAAATLVAANLAWQLGYSRQRLASIAAEIGTDIPFFVHGGAALCSGRGEQIESVGLPSGLPLVVARPPVGLSTPKVYSELGLDRGQACDSTTEARWAGRCGKLVAALRSGAPASSCKGYVRNSLQAAAEQLTDWIGRLGHAFDQLPVLAHQMTGSGSAYFAICRTWKEAVWMAARLRGQHLQVVATRTCL
ncbi:MAG: 4-(cytidine 5'-diphospho)-2-C-methyl-D-erythritol kinase [Aeoliella sp.]